MPAVMLTKEAFRIAEKFAAAFNLSVDQSASHLLKRGFYEGGGEEALEIALEQDEISE